jgi:hypothetical protein
MSTGERHDVVRHRHRLDVGAYDRSVILRCTKKLLALIGPTLLAKPAPTPNAEDWYANLLWFDRRKCLLLSHVGTLFTILEADVSVTDLRSTRLFVTALIDREVLSEDLPPDTFGARHVRRPRFGGHRHRQDGRPKRPGVHERHGVSV